MSVATRRKADLRLLLQDPNGVFPRPIDRVESDYGPVHSHEGDRRSTSDEGAALHTNVLRLVFPVGRKVLEPRTEVVVAGRAAEVHRPVAGLLEPAPADRDVGRAALRLNGVGSAFAKRASLDFPPVAADHVYAGAAASPALDRAAFDHKVINAGELDGVGVSLGADIAHAKPPKCHMVRRLVRVAAVIDVQSVSAGAGDDQVPEFQ